MTTTTKLVKTHRLRKSKSGKLSLIPIVRFRHAGHVFESDIPQDIPKIQSYFKRWKEHCIERGWCSLSFLVAVLNAK